ncbi:hypothetical protein GIB67_004186 [Kingdonia uniflora]|uniref:CCHC-type domain-containing protein n=1 Tax=Kingdonia uniflora TaxID=39325 RepID=A0A7J7LLY8_9MAGN|nr:hypothetical protein GIB67_004186 [Kingdonia uniflora]
MLELLNQLDGFSSDDRIKVITTTNKADILDPALMRPGRLDRKIEFPHPTEEARAQILQVLSFVISRRPFYIFGRDRGRGSHPPIDTPLCDRYRHHPLGSPPRPPRHPYATTWQDDEYSSDSEEELRPQLRRKGKKNDIEVLAKAISEQTHDVHLKVPDFTGKSDADAFIEWLDKVEGIFNYKKYGDPKQVMIIESRLTCFALTWWNSVQQARCTVGYRSISEWWKMRREPKKSFIPMNYGEVAFEKLHSLKMGLSSLDDYTDQYYLLEVRAYLYKTEQQQLAKQANELHVQYCPPVPTTTPIAPAIPIATAPRTFILGNCYGCGKPGNQKWDCPIFTRKVGLVVDAMRERVIATVQRVLQDEDQEEAKMHTTYVHKSSEAPPP